MYIFQEFEWCDGTPVNYTHWADTQPDDWEANKGEDCCMIRIIDYVWNDGPCNGKESWLCKKERGLR